MKGLGSCGTHDGFEYAGRICDNGMEDRIVWRKLVFKWGYCDGDVMIVAVVVVTNFFCSWVFGVIIVGRGGFLWAFL